ncbi:bifunctional phosphopantothenoylcysteine decarboxylase/phosphopantothenate--cysteine ligase CoaBC [bacterium]|nr:bifunctional phosphopantothenoylcysteine decarboxylase/phosphopantothenate--cysteine ligase CoaBC [bacterium]
MAVSKDQEMLRLHGRRVLIAAGGGIAVYKTVELARLLLKRGAEVRVMMTDAATRFVHPTTFAAITGRPVGLQMFHDDGSPEVGHLELPHWADLVLVAPATADLIAKAACGIADDLVTTGLLAARCPVLFAPAMNPSMWEHPATRTNLQTLRTRGAHVVGPETGEMAHPDELPGAGRMSEPSAIVEEVLRLLISSGDLAGRRVLITAGRTEEPIDSVRMLSNRSSGRMGVALAEEALKRGAEVVLVHGPMDVNPPAGVETVRVRSANDMLAAVQDRIDRMDVAIYAAAVSDYRPKQALKGKMKRENTPEPVLELVANPDIAAETASHCPGITVGFALEAGGDLAPARVKRARKGLDAILFNQVDAIGADTNRLTWISDRESEGETSPSASKRELAGWVLDRVVNFLRASP